MTYYSEYDYLELAVFLYSRGSNHSFVLSACRRLVTQGSRNQPLSGQLEPCAADTVLCFLSHHLDGPAEQALQLLHQTYVE